MANIADHQDLGSRFDTQVYYQSFIQCCRTPGPLFQNSMSLDTNADNKYKTIKSVRNARAWKLEPPEVGVQGGRAD